MSTFVAGAGTKLAAGLQTNYLTNASTVVDVPINITSVTLDPTVEKGSEESLIAAKVKDSSYLLSISMEGSFTANLRPEMTDWLFKASTHNTTVETNVDTDYTDYTYTLVDAGNDPVGSTLVLDRPGVLDATYPAMVIRTLTMACPNNDFVTVDVDMVGREEITADRASQITTGGANYIRKTSSADDFKKAGYIVTNGVFRWGADEEGALEWCIESCTITLDNGIEDSPRCYQDGKYANIPVMGRRAISVEISVPYDEKIEAIKDDYLLSNATGYAELTFTSADDENEKITVIMPAVSITSVGAGISGTGVVESTVSGEVIKPAEGEPFTVIVRSKNE